MVQGVFQVGETVKGTMPLGTLSLMVNNAEITFRVANQIISMVLMIHQLSSMM